MITGFRLGADPELFLFDIEKEEYTSAIGLIGGTKDEPIVISKEGFALQEDNVAVEFNIPPAKTKKEFISNIQYMLSYINTILPPNLVTKTEPSAYFDYIQLTHPQAMEFGCSPDFNAWTFAENPKPEGSATNLRTCGGHIHVGYDNPNIDISAKIIKALDIFVGIPLALLEPSNPRKELYGSYGACRFKSYGVEYRTPSNYWLTNAELIGFVYDQTVKAINAIDSGFGPDMYFEYVTDVIENNNLDRGYQLIEELGICNLDTVKVI